MCTRVKRKAALVEAAAPAADVPEARESPRQQAEMADLQARHAAEIQQLAWKHEEAFSVMESQLLFANEQNSHLRGLCLQGLDEEQLLALKQQLEQSLDVVKRAHAEADTSMPPDVEQRSGRLRRPPSRFVDRQASD